MTFGFSKTKFVKLFKFPNSPGYVDVIQFFPTAYFSSWMMKRLHFALSDFLIYFNYPSLPHSVSRELVFSFWKFNALAEQIVENLHEHLMPFNVVLAFLFMNYIRTLHGAEQSRACNMPAMRRMKKDILLYFIKRNGNFLSFAFFCFHIFR